MRKFLAIPKVINGAAIGPTAQTQTCTFEALQNKNIKAMEVTMTVVALATGAGTKTVPTVAMGLSECRFLIGSNIQRRRQASGVGGYFGAQGLNALNDELNAGTVQYFQAGAVISIVGTQTAAAFGNGIPTGQTVGNVPVLIGSKNDLLLQTALANNTATTAVFRLPFLFAEDYRKDVTSAEAMSLPTGIANASGGLASNIGATFWQLDIPPVPNTAGLASTVTIVANEEYDDSLFVPSTAIPSVRLSKEKIYTDNYNVGDFEVADKFTNQDLLQRVSLLTVSDPITKVVVKQGETILWSGTYEDSVSNLAKSGFNIAAIPRNRFDIEFDINDNPSTALQIDPNNDLSIVATFGSANDAAKQVTILPSFYGKIE